MTISVLPHLIERVDSGSVFSGPSRKPKAVFLVSDAVWRRVYGAQQREAIEALTDMTVPLLAPETWRQHPEMTRDAEWIFSSWSMPVVDEEFLDAFPKLQAIFYAAGTVKPFVTDALWKREIIVSSAVVANAVPVAEFTIAQIVLSLKSAWQMAFQIKRDRASSTRQIPTPGVYDATVGLISLGIVGQMVADRLRSFDLKVIAHDPHVDAEKARQLGVELCSLDEIFARADVVSCHAPLLKETEGMLRKSHFAQMKPQATFVNTSRGAIVDEPGMIEALAERPDLTALLDVTWPEPPVAGSRLYELPNVFLTPHIAGSKNRECWRMAQSMVEEAARLLAGEPLRYTVTHSQLALMA